MRFFLPSNLAIGQYELASSFQNYFPSKYHGRCAGLNKGKVALGIRVRGCIRVLVRVRVRVRLWG